MSSEELYIKNIKNAIRGIKFGTKKPEDTNVGFNLNKLKVANLGMYDELLAEYKKILEEYNKKNN